MSRHLPLLMAVLLAAGGTAGAAQRELNTTKRFPATAGKVVVIDAADMDVTVRSADVAEVEVTTELKISAVTDAQAERWVTEHTPEMVDAPDRLTVTVRPVAVGFIGLGMLTARARLGVVVPLGVVPDVTTTSGGIHVRGDFAKASPLRLRTATGDMELEGAAAAVDVRTASGDARLELVRPLDDLFARTSSGDVTLTGGARKVHADTASGDVWLNNLSGDAEVETSSGKITLRWDRLPPDATVTVHSSSGRIRLELPPEASPKGVLRTTAGSIRCDLPGTVNDTGDTVTLAGDGATLEVETASAEMAVSRSEA